MKKCQNVKFSILKFQQDGFTLMEVLVASAIFAVILGALYSTFFLSSKAISGLDESVLKLQEGRAFLDIIRREIGASFYRGNDKKTFFKLEDRDVYGRQASGIAFTGFSPLRGGISEIRYQIKESGDRLILYKEILSPFGANEGFQGADIIEDVGEFSVEARQGDKWIKTWDTALMHRLPDEVKIYLRIKIKDRDVMLFVTSRPMIT